jgi:hypothetical protein
MTTAKDTLEDLSSDPVTQRLARERETAVLMHRHLINSSLEHGLSQGLEQGRAEGRAQEKAQSILEVFEARDIPVSAEHRERILACTDLATLSTWLKRAVTVASADELLEQ